MAGGCEFSSDLEDQGTGWWVCCHLYTSAYEDKGLEDHNAMLKANSAYESDNKIGMPEGSITLANATIYLCLAEKSNSSY